MVIGTLSMIFAHDVRSGVIEANPVDAWKRGRKRRRRSSLPTVSRDKVLSHDELGALRQIARRDAPQEYPLILFLADTGARLGEAIALRWSDVDDDLGSVRIPRNCSMGRFLGPTKSGRALSEYPCSPVTRLPWKPVVAQLLKE